MYYVYILKSKDYERFYIGYASNIIKRLQKHNAGANKSTRPYRPWLVVYTESFPNKRNAWLREQQVKRYKHGEAFRKLIGSLPRVGPH